MLRLQMYLHVKRMVRINMDRRNRVYTGWLSIAPVVRCLEARQLGGIVE
jgi:hypothetical protein